ncbi:MAG: hypothetical protein M3Q44_00840 [bacterium]|nr:hypothetical protein [bacterium]
MLIFKNIFVILVSLVLGYFLSFFIVLVLVQLKIIEVGTLPHFINIVINIMPISSFIISIALMKLLKTITNLMIVVALILSIVGMGFLKLLGSLV